MKASSVWRAVVYSLHLCSTLSFVTSRKLLPTPMTKGDAKVDANKRDVAGLKPAELKLSGTLGKSSLSMASPTPSPPSSDSSSLSWFWRLCLPLWLVYVSNQWSRSALYYVVDFSPKADAKTAINVALSFDEVQYGFLASIAFTALFAVASLVTGWIVDDSYWQTQRKNLTVIAATVWTAAVAVTALASNFETVTIARVTMGLVCAVSTPVAYTLLRDQVPQNRQAVASSLYGTGVAVASGLASLTLVLDRSIGWRLAMGCVASYGCIATLLATALLRSDQNAEATPKAVPVRKKNDNPAATFVSDVREVVTSSRRVQWIFLGSFLRFCSGLCIGVWSAPYFRMVFPENQSNYAVVQAVISGVFASLSGILGGAVADRLTANAGRNQIGRRLWVPVVGSILAAPTWYMAMRMNSFSVAMFWLGCEYLVAECWFGPTISCLQASTRKGGTAQGLFTLTGAVANFAPSILGVIYGQGDAVAENLSYLLTAVVSVCYLLSAACFAVASLVDEAVDDVKDE